MWLLTSIAHNEDLVTFATRLPHPPDFYSLHQQFHRPTSICNVYLHSYKNHKITTLDVLKILGTFRLCGCWCHSRQPVMCVNVVHYSYSYYRLKSFICWRYIVDRCMLWTWWLHEYCGKCVLVNSVLHRGWQKYRGGCVLDLGSGRKRQCDPCAVPWHDTIT